MIELGMLEEMFANIREKTPWDVDGPMLWGYFFFDPDESKLQPLAESLGTDGYRVAGLERTDEGDRFRLHVEKVEVHSPETLFARNEQLGALAQRFGVESYDGMDVGPVAV